MQSALIRYKLAYLLVALYSFIVLWWFRLNFFGIRETAEVYFFGAVYPLIAFVGAINGFLIAKKWGGITSSIGRSIYFFSLGLLSLWFGQTVWSYYNIIIQIEVPYPSIADIGYVAIIPLYTLGSFYLGNASGARFEARSQRGILTIILTPIIIFSIAYVLFLQNLSFDTNEPLRSFLDFIYPFGEAITISVTCIIFLLSYKILGGRMRNRILYLIFALIVQYMTDYTFLFHAAEGIYYNGGIVDLLYATSFFVTSLGLIGLQSDA